MKFTLKREALQDHIFGLTTRSGQEIHKIPGSAETGPTFGTLRDAVNAVAYSGRPLCRTCRIAAEMILNS